MKYVEYFGMRTEPFSENAAEADLLPLPGVVSVKKRMDYILKSGGVMVVVGDVGSGKSTALRWALTRYHPSEVNFYHVTANSGAGNELYKQLCWAVNLDVRSGSRSLLLKKFRDAIVEMSKESRSKIVIVIDEASLLRPDVFAEIHILNQFNFDSEKKFSLVLAGQDPLETKLTYRSSAPLASRVMAKSHLKPLDEEEMKGYIGHHLKVAGAQELFAPNALTAIWKNSRGRLRTANFLAKGALIACMDGGGTMVDEEHVRKAATELIL